MAGTIGEGKMKRATQLSDCNQVTGGKKGADAARANTLASWPALRQR